MYWEPREMTAKNSTPYTRANSLAHKFQISPYWLVPESTDDVAFLQQLQGFLGSRQVVSQCPPSLIARVAFVPVGECLIRVLWKSTKGDETVSHLVSFTVHAAHDRPYFPVCTKSNQTLPS